MILPLTQGLVVSRGMLQEELQAIAGGGGRDAERTLQAERDRSRWAETRQQHDEMWLGGAGKQDAAAATTKSCYSSNKSKQFVSVSGVTRGREARPHMRVCNQRASPCRLKKIPPLQEGCTTNYLPSLWLEGSGGARLQNLTEATHMLQNFPALRAGISPETEQKAQKFPALRAGQPCEWCK